MSVRFIGAACVVFDGGCPGLDHGVVTVPVSLVSVDVWMEEGQLHHQILVRACWPLSGPWLRPC